MNSEHRSAVGVRSNSAVYRANTRVAGGGCPELGHPLRDLRVLVEEPAEPAGDPDDRGVAKSWVASVRWPVSGRVRHDVAVPDLCLPGLDGMSLSGRD
jgi:hypothetical protein